MKKPLTSADVQRALAGGNRYTVTRLGERFNVSESNLRVLLKAMQARGEVFRKAEHVEGSRGQRAVYLYYTSDPQPVAKPYRDLHLTETLTGYSATLTRHMALCNTRRFA